MVTFFFAGYLLSLSSQKNLFTPQTVANDQGIQWSKDTFMASPIVVEVVHSRFNLFVSHQTSLKVRWTDSQIHILICRDAPYYVRGVGKLYYL